MNLRQSICPVIMLAGMGSLLATSFPAAASEPEHRYSHQLVQRYNSGCSSQLEKRGYSPRQASQLCACSIKQMQRQHSQSSAIVMLTSAQLNPIRDPKLGLPKTLSKYFTPCFG